MKIWNCQIQEYSTSEGKYSHAVLHTVLENGTIGKASQHFLRAK